MSAVMALARPGGPLPAHAVELRSAWRQMTLLAILWPMAWRPPSLCSRQQNGGTVLIPQQGLSGGYYQASLLDVLYPFRYGIADRQKL